MDARWMGTLCPGARLQGPAVLEEHRFLINTLGYASVTPAGGSHVHGLTWQVSEADFQALDRYEGVADGLYARIRAQVRSRGGLQSAWVYVARDQQAGRARPDYLDQIVTAARAAELPEAYIHEIASNPVDLRGGA